MATKQANLERQSLKALFKTVSRENTKINPNLSIYLSRSQMILAALKPALAQTLSAAAAAAAA